MWSLIQIAQAPQYSISIREINGVVVDVEGEGALNGGIALILQSVNTKLIQLCWVIKLTSTCWLAQIIIAVSENPHSIMSPTLEKEFMAVCQ